jgi:hypothetical protein
MGIHEFSKKEDLDSVPEPKEIEVIASQSQIRQQNTNTNTNTNTVIQPFMGKKVIILNFEDDTIRPVLKIYDKYMDILEDWYNTCQILIDIEETDITIPNEITSQDLSGALFKDINCKFKHEFLNSYLPLVINTIISQRNIQRFEKLCFEHKPLNKVNDKVNDKVKNKINDKANNNDIFYDLELAGNIVAVDQSELIYHTRLGISLPKNMDTHAYINPDKIIGNSPCYYTPTKKMPNHQLRVDPDVPKTITQYELDGEIKPVKTTAYNSSAIDLPSEINCYNHKYNSLYPAFGTTCASFIYDDDDDTTNVVKNEKQPLLVIIHDTFLQTIVLEKYSQDMITIINKHPEFGFIKLFSFETNNNDIIQFVNREFNNARFNEIDEVNKKILVTSQYIEFSDKHNNTNQFASNEEKQVRYFLKRSYEISDNIHHKIKASALYDIIVSSDIIKINPDKMAGFRTRLAKYLNDMGLKKKRYNDGFYYYGIVLKQTNYVSASDTSSRTITLEDIINQRNLEEASYRFK